MRFTLASIAAEARKAEELWVSQGGSLVDAQVLQHWNSYDQAWANMPSRLRTAKRDIILIKFDDIPWPLKGVGEREFQMQDLTVERVEEWKV